MKALTAGNGCNAWALYQMLRFVNSNWLEQIKLHKMQVFKENIMKCNSLFGVF